MTPQPQRTGREDQNVESRGWIGVEIKAITQGVALVWDLKNTTGAFVDQTQPNSPAVKAGVKRGDVITAVNGTPVLNARQLALLIGAMAPGTTVTLGLIHDDQQRTVSLTLGTPPDEKAAGNGSSPFDPSTAQLERKNSPSIDQPLPVSPIVAPSQSYRRWSPI